MKPYYRKQALHFDCTGCGRCCTGTRDYYVEVGVAEQARIQKALGVSRAWFRRRYLKRFDDGVVSLVMPQGRCIFLGDDGRCGIYAVRPLQCRTYPFWPEVIGRQSAWRLEARRCEGIGRGAAVPVHEIERRLKQQKT